MSSKYIVPFFFILFSNIYSEKCPLPTIVSIVNEPYIIKTLYQNEDSEILAPITIMAQDQGILFNTDNTSFMLNSEMQKEKFNFDVPMKLVKAYIYPSGEGVTIINGTGGLDKKTGTGNIVLIISKGYIMQSLAVDSTDKRIYFLCFHSTGTDIASKVYVLDKLKTRRLGKKFLLEEVKGLGNNVTAIAVDRASGNIIFSAEDYHNGIKTWSIKILDKVDKTPPKKSASKFDKEVLESAIEKAMKNVIFLYQDAVMGGDLSVEDNQVESILKCYNDLKGYEDASERIKTNIQESYGRVLEVMRFLRDIKSSENFEESFNRNFATILKIFQTISKKYNEKFDINSDAKEKVTVE